MSLKSWCEHWNINVYEDKTQTICCSHRRVPVGAFLTLKGQQIPNVNNVKDLGAVFYKKNYTEITCRNTQSPIQWVPGALSLGVKRPERETLTSI